MSYKRFQDGDVLLNRIKTHNDVEYIIRYDYTTFYNKQNSGSNAGSDIQYCSVNPGRSKNGFPGIYPYLPKSSQLDTLSSVSQNDFYTAEYGSQFNGVYPLTSSITVDYYNLNDTRLRVDAMKNTLDRLRKLSKHYSYSSSLGDKSTQALCCVSIPTAYCGSGIKKGSVELSFYSWNVTSQLLILEGMLVDSAGNGELKQVSGAVSTNDGKVAGVVLYEQGAIILTGSWALRGSTTWLGPPNGPAPTVASDKYRWKYFGQGSTTNVKPISIIKFQGTNYIPVITAFCHIEKGEGNNSSNPTWIDRDSANYKYTFASGTYNYDEYATKQIKNTAASIYTGHTASFVKQTYISKIGIYDQYRNLIAIAKLATPIRKPENRDYTFKLKLDIS